MRDERPSATAWRVAWRRAAHQVLDRPLVFDDPLALRVVGATPETFPTNRRQHSLLERRYRAFIAVRSRFAEDQLRRAFDRGVRQYVLLGAGLDTFAYRNPFRGLRIFEVDHPATQDWKRTLLSKADISLPDSLTMVSADFEREDAFEGLRRAGFDAKAPAFFAWLGVTIYLAAPTVISVLQRIAGLAEGSGVVLDYAIAGSELGILRRLARARAARRAAKLGEPWITFFVPAELIGIFRNAGFRDIEDLEPEEINRRYFSGRADRLAVGSVGRLMVASR